ncbi:MAG: hypothetical protein HQK53_04405 [Oligoflexia bacterium]|nr:hypothetical protein [Oligoflexia bacterium]
MKSFDWNLDWQELLFRRWQEKRLAHFYLLQLNDDSVTKNIHTDADQRRDFLRMWMHGFLEKVLAGRKISSLQQLHHPDILYISMNDQASSSGQLGQEYRIKDFEEFFHFLNFSPWELSGRIVIVEDIQFIGEILANKMLKILENPAPGSVIFFLQSVTARLLPTLEGRALTVKLRRPLEKLEKADDRREVEIDDRALQRIFQIVSEKRPEALSEVAEIFKRDPKLYNQAVATAITKEQEYIESGVGKAHAYERKEKFLQRLKWIIEVAPYHLGASERARGFLELFKV